MYRQIRLDPLAMLYYAGLIKKQVEKVKEMNNLPSRKEIEEQEPVPAYPAQ